MNPRTRRLSSSQTPTTSHPLSSIDEVTPNKSKWALELIERFLKEGMITRADLDRLLAFPEDPCDPSIVRNQEETWLRSTGIEKLLGRPLKLTQCPFSRAELLDFQARKLVVLCIPAETSMDIAARAFGFSSWATCDELVSSESPREDDWFATPVTMEPLHKGFSAQKAIRIFQERGWAGFNIQRYLIYVARMRSLTGQLPDLRWWTWLLRTRYDASGMLIAGLDRKERLNIHAWMKNFSAKFLGARYCLLPTVPSGASRDPSGH